MKHEVFVHSINNKKQKVRNVKITLLFALFAVVNGFAQQFIDIVNAPLNPIAYIENKNQLNVKGDIAFYNNANEGFIYFDKNGNRLFDLLYTLYTNKEKARINKGTYLELDNQKKAVYKENFYFDNKIFYAYNPNGTVSKVETQGKYPSVATYEYDNDKRVIKAVDKKNAKTTVTTYTYKTIGNRIIIAASETVTENSQSKSRTFEYAYENGLLMKFTENGSEDNYTYTYDTKGNWVTNSFRYGNVNREFYYYSELGQWDKWRWIYKKTNTTYSPYLMIGNRRIKMLTIGFNDLDNFTDILFYEPITATTLVAENVVTTTGLSQGTGDGKISTLKAKNLMYTSVKGNIKFFVEGYNKSGNLKQVFIGKTYVIYDASSSQIYWCKGFEKSKKINVFEDLGKDAFLWYKSEKNDIYFWQNGAYISASGYTLGETLNDGSKLLYKNQKPVSVMENFTSSIQNTFYKVIPYSGQAIPKITTTTQINTSTAGSNTSWQTTETRYYNGKYNKETTFEQLAGYIAKFNKSEGFKFTKGKTFAEQIDGTWEQQLPQDMKLVIHISYLLGDDRLTIKVIDAVFQKNGQTLILSPQEKEAARKLVSRYTEGPFEHLQINNNTTLTQANATTAGSSDNKSQYVSDANTYKDELKKSTSDGDQFIYKMIREQRAETKTDDQIAEYFYQIYNHLYPTDKETSFMIIYRICTLSSDCGISQKAKAKMTQEQYKVFSQQAYDRFIKE